MWWSNLTLRKVAPMSRYLLLLCLLVPAILLANTEARAAQPKAPAIAHEFVLTQGGRWDLFSSSLSAKELQTKADTKETSVGLPQPIRSSSAANTTVNLEPGLYFVRASPGFKLARGPEAIVPSWGGGDFTLKVWDSTTRSYARVTESRFRFSSVGPLTANYSSNDPALGSGIYFLESREISSSALLPGSFIALSGHPECASCAFPPYTPMEAKLVVELAGKPRVEMTCQGICAQTSGFCSTDLSAPPISYSFVVPGVPDVAPTVINHSIQLNAGGRFEVWDANVDPEAPVFPKDPKFTGADTLSALNLEEGIYVVRAPAGLVLNRGAVTIEETSEEGDFTLQVGPTLTRSYGRNDASTFFVGVAATGQTSMYTGDAHVTVRSNDPAVGTVNLFSGSFGSPSLLPGTCFQVLGDVGCGGGGPDSWTAGMASLQLNLEGQSVTNTSISVFCNERQSDAKTFERVFIVPGLDATPTDAWLIR